MTIGRRHARAQGASRDLPRRRRAQGQRLGRRPGRRRLPARRGRRARSGSSASATRPRARSRASTASRTCCTRPARRRRTAEPRCRRGRALRLTERLSVARARVAVPGPGREHEQQPRVADRLHRVALVGIEHRGACPAPPVCPPSSTSPSITTTYARSCTWCSCSSSPAGRLIRIDRASPRAECRIFGWCGSTSSVRRSQCSMAAEPTASLLGGLAQPRDRLADDARDVHLRDADARRRSRPASGPRRSAGAAPRARGR